MTQEEKHCMNCSCKWSDDDLYKIVLKSWCKKNLLVKDVKFEQHRAQFARVMPIVDYINSILLVNEQPEPEDPSPIYSEIKNLKFKMEQDLRVIDADLNYNLTTIKYTEDDINAKMELIKKVYKMKNYLTTKEAEYKEKQKAWNDYRMKKYYYTETYGNVKKLFKMYKKENIIIPNHKNVNYIMNCNQPDCKGMVDTNGKCAICDKSMCLDCFKNKEDEHECNADDIETAKMIMKETRPCPQCSIRISKIDGCDQMWCTQCHVVFSWETGKVQKGGHIHNPHYIQHVRENQHVVRDVGDEVCGGIPNNTIFYDFIVVLLRNITINQFEQYNKLENIYNVSSYYLNRFLQNKRREIRDYGNNDDEYCKYLLNMCSKEVMMRAINKKENKRQMLLSALVVYEMYGEFIIDCINNFMHECSGQNSEHVINENIEKYYERYESGRQMFSTELSKSIEKYSSEFKVIHSKIIRQFDANTTIET